MESATLLLRALALASVTEIAVPLRQQSRRSNGRLATNLWLLGITLALGTGLNFTLALGAEYVRQSGGGLLQLAKFGSATSFIASLLALDAATYLVHRLVHQ